MWTLIFLTGAGNCRGDAVYGIPAPLYTIII